MPHRLLTILLATGLLLALIALGPALARARLPGNHQGYSPEQPIAYSHRLHAGELQIPCLYCHFGAERSRHAGLPPASVCMNCHRHVTARLSAVKAEQEAAAAQQNPLPERPQGAKAGPPALIIAPELQKLYAAAGWAPDAQGRLAPDPAQTPQPLAWVQIHALPDFVFFDHRRHVAAGVSCQDCHGPVETMERVRQEADLSMGWCVNCHRRVNEEGVAGRPVHASTDCAGCHY